MRNGGKEFLLRIPNFRNLVKSILKRDPGESRGPKLLEITGFGLSPE